MKKQEKKSNYDSIELPIKRVEGDTVEDVLNDNAYNNILPARYLRKDEKGEVIETPEGMFERVAKNVALADAVYISNDNEFKIEATPQDIKPDSTESRRRELCDEVFGSDVGLESNKNKVVIDENNINAFSYDTIVPKLPEEERESVESTYINFYEDMTSLSFIPNSPTLMNAGDDFQQLSACFVDSPSDDIENIHKTAKEAAKIFQSGGGMGYSFSQLRPYGDRVGSTGGIASGPISFMRTYDRVCETIAQGGKRRGAQMGILRVDHPDIIQFLHAKDKDVSLAHSLRLNDPDDFTHTSFGQALEEARDLIQTDENGVDKVPEHLRNAAEGHLSNFNISVGVTDSFMDAVKNDEEYTLYNPRTGEPYVANEKTKELYEWFGLGEQVEVGEEMSIPAEEIFERITEGAWENGEPGMIFLERANKRHSFDVEEYPEHKILATNPCGEQPLEEYEACNLGHINLSTIVDVNAPDWRDFSSDYNGSLESMVEEFLEHSVDWNELNGRVKRSTHFLENVVTMSKFPVDQITEKVSSNRKIGLGIMGLAQFYIQLGIKYGTEEANEVARQLMRHINHKSKHVSHKMATGKGDFAERGSFDNWNKSKYSEPENYPEWFKDFTDENPKEWSIGYPIRNHNTTTIAPTGTTSMIGDTTGGCEPIYQVAYYKNVTQDVQGEDMLVEFDDYFIRTLRENDIDIQSVKEEAQKQMSNNNFDGIGSLDSVPSEIGELFVTTDQLSANQHARIQCSLQSGVDSAISKTVNAPSDATPEDTKESFMIVYDEGGKGITYYRDGTRSKQVLTTRKDNQETQDEVDKVKTMLENDEIQPSDLGIEQFNGIEENVLNTTEPMSRPTSLDGKTKEVKTGYGDLFVTINELEEGKPFEVFANIGKSGGYTESFTEATARLISLCLRCGIDPEVVTEQIEDIRSPKPSWDNGKQVHSVPDGISLAMRRYMNETNRESTNNKEENGQSVNQREDYSQNTGENDVIGSGENPECPECGLLSLYYSEGCKTCESCGWSEC